MSNLSDKEIDRLSREAADSYEPDHAYLSWSRLEQKLIEQLPGRPPDGFSLGRFNPYLWGPAVVLIAGASFFFIKNSFYSPHSTQTSKTATQIKTIPYQDSGKGDHHAGFQDFHSLKQKNSASDSSQAFQPVAPLSVTSSEVASVNQEERSDQQSASNSKTNRLSANSPVSGNPADNTGSAQGGRSGITAPAAEITTGSLISRNEKTKKSESPSAQTNALGIASTTDIAATEILAPGNLQNALTQAQTGENARAVSQHNLPPLAISGIALGKVAGSDSLLNRLTKSSSVPVPQKSMHINRSLNIGFAFGTDYTNAGGIPNNQLSNNIGITLGYYLTNKLSINTGINYSNKFYWSPGHEHDRPASNWNPPPPSPPAYYRTTYAYGPDIEYVNGACNMYELPLTLRYDFARDDKTKFFVNAGLSSYFMLKQTYIYFYHSGGRPLAYKSDIEAQSNYWFGVGDLSFGLETDMGKGFSFQAEPFFRIPLQKMGFENLKMYSYGIMLSFRYAPVLSRTKK